MSDVELPPLPTTHPGINAEHVLYSADRMRAYAIAAIEAYKAQAQPVAWAARTHSGLDLSEERVSLEEARYDEIFPLYAAPPAQIDRVRVAEVVREVHEYLYNPFEPDNQSRMYKRVGDLLTKLTEGR